ncbi:hypothetical protein BDR07DRAFT_774518 [Suillus spraguei]|nr:hypothetical protein BDR07DRAFT_774518 [Suillus spraguei]
MIRPCEKTLGLHTAAAIIMAFAMYIRMARWMKPTIKTLTSAHCLTLTLATIIILNVALRNLRHVQLSILHHYFIPTEAIQKNPAFKYPTNTGRSEVWRCFMTLPEQSKNLCVAVKSITFRNPTEDEIKKAKKVILHQASIWIELYHDNILRLEGIINDGFGPLPALVSPWMENGSLDEYLKLRQLDLNKKLFMVGFFVAVVLRPGMVIPYFRLIS